MWFIPDDSPRLLVGDPKLRCACEELFDVFHAFKRRTLRPPLSLAKD